MRPTRRQSPDLEPADTGALKRTLCLATRGGRQEAPDRSPTAQILPLRLLSAWADSVGGSCTAQGWKRGPSGLRCRMLSRCTVPCALCPVCPGFIDPSSFSARLQLSSTPADLSRAFLTPRAFQDHHLSVLYTFAFRLVRNGSCVFGNT